MPTPPGRLLVATHELMDRRFRHTVVLLLAHQVERGAVGVVLNRPTTAAPPDRLDGWLAAIAPPSVLFLGGPVSAESVIAVAVADVEEPADGWTRLQGRIGVLDLHAAAKAHGLSGLRLFAGHAGWAPGQLEAEVDAGAWFVIDAVADDPLTGQPDRLWRAVLARQGGVFTTVPMDPELN